MKGITVDFRNKPNQDGTTSNFVVKDCLIAQSGSPASRRPQVIVHLPKADPVDVTGAWFEYERITYHVIGVEAPSIQENTPTRWNRYIIAEKMY